MRSLHALTISLVLAGCRPDFGLPVSVVTQARVLAVQATPPEARPGDVVHLRAYPVSEAGPLLEPLSFAFCSSPRPQVESNIVSGDCLGPQGQVVPIADGVQETDATLPVQGCLDFGPDTPPQQSGQPPSRPRAPDVTGGYDQPVRVTLAPDVESVALVRLRCALPGASAQAAVDFNARYVDNTNPSFDGISLEQDGGTVDPAAVPGSASVTLRVAWPASEVETYVVHSQLDDTLTEHREAFRVSWFTTAGLIPVVTTGRGEDDLGTDTTTTWQTPASGSGTLWAVLRDSRGGSALRALPFYVR
jgi:hypothetical protein